jgi:hypothetical protein
LAEPSRIGGSEAFISMTTLSTPQPLQGAQHVLDRVDLGVARLNRRGAHEVGHLVDPRT